MSGELLVGVGHGVELLLNDSLVQRVQVDGLGVARDSADALASANDAGGDNDVVEGGLVHGLEGTGAGTLLAGVSDLSLGVNGSVDDDDDGPSELLLEVVDHVGADLLVELERSVGDLDQVVLVLAAVSGVVLDLLNRVDVHHAQVLLDVLVGLLEGDEGLGGLLLDLSGVSLLLLELGAVEHFA